LAAAGPKPPAARWLTETSSLSPERASFDIDADGVIDEIPTLRPGSAFLARDTDGDGVIGDGTEVLGAVSGDAFADLAALDGDGNGWIDEGDAAWDMLRLWEPSPDGHGTVATLAERGIGALYVGRVAAPYTLAGPDGTTLGTAHEAGLFLHEHGASGTLQRIDVAV